MVRSLYRPRLARGFDERTARFHTSVAEDLRILEEDIDGTEAHDIMLHERGVIPLRALRSILSALEGIRGEWRRGELELGAEFEDVHEYIEGRVIEKVGAEAGGMLHTGRSRNDQVAVDIRLRLRRELLDVAEGVLDLMDALLGRAERHTATLMILYTHGQHAQVGTFAHYLLAHADALARDFQRLMDCFRRVNLNPLGAGPVGGTSIPIDRGRTTELLGFDGLAENSMDATGGRDWAIEAAAACAILMSNLSRAAADLVEWSTAEFGYVELSDEYASSSSIMPQKKNPSTLELVRGRTAEVYAALAELLTMVKGLPSGYSQDLQVTKPPLWRCLDTVGSALAVVAGAVGTLRVDEGRMRERVAGSPTVAVDLAERLVEGAGMPFREAHRLVAALVRGALDRGARLQDLGPGDVAEASLRALGRRVEVDADLLREATDPEACLMRRRSQGGPHPREVERMLVERRRLVGEYRATLGGRRSALRAAEKRLEEAVENYVRGGPSGAGGSKAEEAS